MTAAKNTSTRALAPAQLDVAQVVRQSLERYIKRNPLPPAGAR